MQSKCLLAIILTCTVLTLFGCSGPKPEAQPLNNETEPSNSVTITPNFLKPPSLTVSAGEERILAVPGSYSWSVTSADGTIEGVEADADSPFVAVKKHKAKEITPDTKIELNFEVPPESYVIHIVNEEGTTAASSTDFNLDEQTGRVVYEVRSYWKEGTASYAFPLYIKK